MSAMAANVEAKMSFADHLDELRSRLFRALLAILAGVVVGWNYKEQLLAWLLRPLEIAWFCRGRDCRPPTIFGWMLHPGRFALARVQAGSPPGATIHFAGPTDAFVAYFKLAAMGGTLIALPVIFYQLWAFVAPGLYDREKKLVLPFVFLSTLFFVAGSLFGYYLVFPIGYEWFLGFSGMIPGSSAQIVPTIMMEDYLGFTSQMLLAFGVVFEMPLFIFFMALAGIVTSKQLFGFGRYFTVIAFILAAVLTPSTDVYSQVMLGAPLVALYFLAAALAAVFGPKEARGFRRGMKSQDPPTKPRE
jgi:sec-independent protein translocase protein TatC